jgi:hypothetical protein
MKHKKFKQNKKSPWAATKPMATPRGRFKRLVAINQTNKTTAASAKR